MHKGNRTALVLISLGLGLGRQAVAAGETLLVLHKWDESIGAYDPDSGQRRGGTIALGTVPHEMVLSPDGKQLYVTNYGVKTYTDTAPGGNVLSIVDLPRGAKIGEIALGAYRRPHGIELGRSGRLYLTTDFPPAVLVVDPRARKVAAAYALDQKLPHMLALTRDERVVYVANSGSGTVTALRPGQAGAPPALRNVQIGGTPMGLVLSPDETRLYATNRDGNAVVVIDTRTERVSASMPLPGAPARLALLPDGRHLLVSLIEAGDVALLDTASAKVVKRVHVGQRAEGLFVDPRGRFACVAVQAENKVVKLALPSLQKVGELATGDRPDAMALVSGQLTFARGQQPPRPGP